MEKRRFFITTILAIVIAVGFIVSGNKEYAQAAMAKSGTYQGKSVTLQVMEMSKSSKRSDFSPISFFNGKEYKKPAYRYIKIIDSYGTFMGFENEPCCKKSKKSMIAWSGGSGVGGGQTCWAVISRKSANKITLKVYWQNNMSALTSGAKPECILKETLKRTGR